MGSVFVIRDGVGMAHMGHPSTPYLSLGISPEPSNRLRKPVGLSLAEIPLLGPSKSCLGRRRAACAWLRLVSCAQHAVVVGPCLGHVPSI